MEYDLRKRRHELGLSIKATAEKAGISPASVRAMEKGLFHGKPLTLKKIADALEISVRLLMSDDERRAVLAGDRKVMDALIAFMKKTGMTPEQAFTEFKNMVRTWGQTPKP